MKAHVHIYTVQEEAEIEIDNANNLEGAKEKALAQVKQLSFREPDCRYIAIAWDMGRSDYGGLSKVAE